MTGKISRKSKILRAVIFTASLVWAGLPVKTAAEGTTNDSVFELIDEMPKTITFPYVPRVIKDETMSNGWRYADEHYAIRLTGSYKTYKNINDNSYYYYFNIRGTQIMPANMSSQLKKNTAGPYNYPYGILKYAIKWENQVAFDGYVAVSNYYQGEQSILMKISSIFYKLSNIPVNFNSTNGELIYWNYYNSQSSGSSGTDEETAQNITNILNELKADPEKMEQITTTTTQNNEALEEIAQQEQEVTDAANENIEQIDPNGVFQNELFTSGKLGNALMWIREVHRQTIEATQIGNIVSVTLILGLAAYMIGRRGG